MEKDNGVTGDRKTHIAWQIAVVIGILLTFLLSAAFSSCTTARMTVSYGIALCVLLAAFFACCAVCWKKGFALSVRRSDLSNVNIALLVFFVLFVVLRLLQFRTLPRWDSDTYFTCLRSACENFAFTWDSFLSAFKLADHIAYGYSIFWAIGYYLLPDSFVGVYLINLLLTAVAFFMTYDILRRCVPAADRLFVSFGAFIIWCMPMNLGVFHGIALDYGILFFLVYLLYFHMRKAYVLACFSALLLVTTKESGIVCIAGYCAGYLLCLCINSDQRGIRRLLSVLRDRSALVMIGTGICGAGYIAYLMFVKRSMWGMNHGKSWYGECFNTLAVNPEYIILKLKTLFVLNFYWLWLLIALLCLFILFKRKFGTYAFLFRRYPALFCYIGAVCAFCLFSMLFLTYNNPRYHLCVEYTLALFGVMLLLLAAPHARKTMLLIFCMICTLMLGQSYLTIDPVTKIVFPTVDTGGTFPMVSTGWDKTLSLKADITVYNYQYVYLDRAYDQILRDIQYRGDTDLIFWGPSGLTVEAACIGGWAGRYYWDTEKQERTVSEGEHTVPLNPIYQKKYEDELHESGQLNDLAIWIYTPHFENNEIELYSELDIYYHIDVVRREAGSELGGKVYYYIMELR